MIALDLAACGNALRWEWYRFSRRAALWVILGLAGLAVVGVLAVALILQNAGPLGLAIPPTGFPLLVFEALSRLGPFLGIILAALVFGGDYGWGTLRPLLARGQPRWQAALVKLILPCAILAAVWIIAWIAAVAVGLVAGESSAVFDLFSDAPSGWWGTAGIFFSAWPVAIAYVALTALLCTLGRSTAFGLGIAIAILIFEAVVYPVAGMISQLALDTDLGDYTRWTLQGATSGLMGRDDDFGPWLFLPATLAYLAAFWALTLAVTTRRDVASGSG